jgi:hypothetical protein
VTANKEIVMVQGTGLRQVPALAWYGVFLNMGYEYADRAICGMEEEDAENIESYDIFVRHFLFYAGSVYSCGFCAKNSGYF